MHMLRSDKKLEVIKKISCNSNNIIKVFDHEQQIKFDYIYRYQLTWFYNLHYDSSLMLTWNNSS